MLVSLRQMLAVCDISMPRSIIAFNAHKSKSTIILPSSSRYLCRWAMWGVCRAQLRYMLEHDIATGDVCLSVCESKLIAAGSHGFDYSFVFWGHTLSPRVTPPRASNDTGWVKLSIMQCRVGYVKSENTTYLHVIRRFSTINRNISETVEERHIATMEDK